MVAKPKLLLIFPEIGSFGDERHEGNWALGTAEYSSVSGPADAGRDVSNVRLAPF